MWGRDLQMNRNVIRLTAAALVLLVLIAPAFGMLSEFQATAAAAKYQNPNELATVFGPYTYQDHPYFYIKFTESGIKTGVIIIDGISGNSSDLETARKIAFTHYVLGDITFENTAEMTIRITELRRVIRETQEAQNELKRIMTFPHWTAAERNEMRELEIILPDLIMSYTNFMHHMEQALTIERDVLNGSKTYENAIKRMEISGELHKETDRQIEILIKMGVIMNRDFDPTEMKVLNDELKRREQIIQRSVDWDIASMEERQEINAISNVILIGLVLFVAFVVFATVAILIVLTLYMRKKKT